MNPQMSRRNGPDWAQAFADFHARHRDANGKKLLFTAVFNAAMEAFMDCPEVPLVWRILAWVWRHSWGNDSDYCVNDIGGSPVGQQACADHFEVDKRRVNDCVVTLRTLNFLLPPNGHRLYPVDDPSNSPTSKSPGPSGLLTIPLKSPGPSGLFQEFCEEWKVRDRADFLELESAEATVNRLKLVRLRLYKEWVKARSNHALPIKTNLEIIEEYSGEPAAASFVVAAAADSLPPEEPDLNLPDAPVTSSPPPTLPESHIEGGSPDEPPPPLPDVAAVAQTLGIEHDAAELIVLRTHAILPDVTQQEIVEQGQRKLAELAPRVKSGKVYSPIGILVNSVPQLCIQARKEARARAQEQEDDRVRYMQYLEQLE